MNRRALLVGLAINLALLSSLVGLACHSPAAIRMALGMPALLAASLARDVLAGELELEPAVVAVLVLPLFVVATFAAAVRWPRRSGLVVLAHLSTLPYFCLSLWLLTFAP